MAMPVERIVTRAYHQSLRTQNEDIAQPTDNIDEDTTAGTEKEHQEVEDTDVMRTAQNASIMEHHSAHSIRNNMEPSDNSRDRAGPAENTHPRSEASDINKNPSFMMRSDRVSHFCDRNHTESKIRHDQLNKPIIQDVERHSRNDSSLPKYGDQANGSLPQQAISRECPLNTFMDRQPTMAGQGEAFAYRQATNVVDYEDNRSNFMHRQLANVMDHETARNTYMRKPQLQQNSMDACMDSITPTNRKLWSPQRSLPSHLPNYRALCTRKKLRKQVCASASTQCS